MNDCYVDLHLHIDGAVSPATAIAVAKMEGIALPTMDEKELLSYLEVPEGSKDLVDYLKTFDLPVSLMQSRTAISEVTYRVQEDLRAQGVIYAELRFAPQLHTRRGLTQGDVVQAALEGLERSPLKSNLILCCMRFADNQAANLETVRVAEEFLNKGVVGLDIAGSEADGPIENYADIFKKAKESGIPFTIHAGEAAGADSVRKAVEMGHQGSVTGCAA